MVLDIIKDFAMVDRREYVPYCPLCATIFATSAEMQVFSCNHFLCTNCLQLLPAQVCPFCKADVQTRTGEFLGDAVNFLATWMTEVGQGRDRAQVVDQLIEQILMVRKNLKCRDLPCRIQAEGRDCAQQFKCPYDHTLLMFQKQICDIPRCPHGDHCLFLHSPASQPVSQPSNPPEERKQPISQSPISEPASTQKRSVEISSPPPPKPQKEGSNKKPGSNSHKKSGSQSCCTLS